MNIREYYANTFRHDLGDFMPNQRLRYFGQNWQYDCGALASIPQERRGAFLICLYFTVLIDQAVYSHHREHYQKFESLTMYPKFCHGLGQVQKNPRAILSSPVERSIVDAEQILELVDDGMSLFVDEVMDFCDKHMPEIDAQQLLEKLLEDPDVQIPLLIPMMSPEMQDDVVVAAFMSLRAAVRARFSR